MAPTAATPGCCGAPAPPGACWRCAGDGGKDARAPPEPRPEPCPTPVSPRPPRRFFLDIAYYAQNLFIPQILSDLGWTPKMNLNDPSSVCERACCRLAPPPACCARPACRTLLAAGRARCCVGARPDPPRLRLILPRPPPPPPCRADNRMFSTAKGQTIITLMGTFPGYFFTIYFIEKRIGRKGIQYMVRAGSRRAARRGRVWPPSAPSQRAGAPAAPCSRCPRGQRGPSLCPPRPASCLAHAPGTPCNPNLSLPFLPGPACLPTARALR